MATAPTSPLSLTTFDPEDQGALDEVKASRKALQELLLERQSALINPTFLAMAQGFLAPTKTGSFGESLGNVAGQLAPVQEAERRREIQTAQMRAELASQELAERQATGRQKLAGQVYRTSESGDLEIDPEAAMRYARATGDLKAMDAAVAAQRKQRIQSAAKGVLVDKEVTDESGNKRTMTTFDPTAAYKVARLSDDPVSAIAAVAKNIPLLRKAGLMGDLPSEEPTPFDALILMADQLGPQGPALKERAKNLAEQYRKGYIDDDKANAFANQLFNTANSSVDRQTAQQNQMVIQGLMVGLRQQGLQLQMESAQERRDRLDQESRLKLTDEQKEVLRKIVTPTILEGAKGATALAQVQQLRQKIEKAPSGAISGAFASSVGRLLGTDENTALRELTSLSKALIPQIPRLPGAASNLDAQNLELSIGRLSDITLTNQQRRDLVKDIEQRLKLLVDRADAVQQSWDSTKTVPMSVLGGSTPPAGTGQRRTFTVIGTEPAGRQ